MFTTAVGQGWAPEQAVGAAAVAANGNAAAQKLSLGGFPPNTPVQLLVYNTGGSGQLASRAVRTNAQGFVTVSVPPHGVAAATTRLEPPGG